MKYFVAVLVIALGAVGVVVGGIDDSPGFQLLSLVVIVGAVALCVRWIVRRSR
ncbi:MAG TPA: hypothetical protein VHQ68_03745 [Propionibacteriaceae bacterium]|jgi:hypothetical protein|nr:hypothetical protein [Propionibacteriaceae bacterium]